MNSRKAGASRVRERAPDSSASPTADIGAPIAVDIRELDRVSETARRPAQRVGELSPEPER